MQWRFHILPINVGRAKLTTTFLWPQRFSFISPGSSLFQLFLFVSLQNWTISNHFESFKATCGWGISADSLNTWAVPRYENSHLRSSSAGKKQICLKQKPVLPAWAAYTKCYITDDRSAFARHLHSYQLSLSWPWETHQLTAWADTKVSLTLRTNQRERDTSTACHWWMEHCSNSEEFIFCDYATKLSRLNGQTFWRTF